jgi:hypothetical protein
MSGNHESMRATTAEEQSGLDVKAATQRILSIRPIETNAREMAEMLLTSSNVEDFQRIRLRRGWGGASFEQTLLPVFRLLFVADEKVRAETIRDLQGLGIDDVTIEEYFTKMGMQPILGLAARYGEEKGREWAYSFVAKAREIIFKMLKKKVSER